MRGFDAIERSSVPILVAPALDRTEPAHIAGSYAP
jgi:hypothetical protein